MLKWKPNRFSKIVIALFKPWMPRSPYIDPPPVTIISTTIPEEKTTAVFNPKPLKLEGISEECLKSPDIEINDS